MGQRLMREMNLFCHVTKEHDFEDDYHFYRYTKVESTPVSISGRTGKMAVSDADATDFPGMLVAVSGSPNFEIDMLQALRDLGLSKKQAITFHAATTQL